MFAETFNVRPWLEEPSKWLRWAAQSLTARKLQDARYNLQQFWNGLAAYKSRAATPLDWAELYTLDGQSKETLARLYDADIQGVLAVMSNSMGLFAEADKDKIKRLEESKTRALAEAQEFSQKAQAYYTQAKHAGAQQATAGAENAKRLQAYALKDLNLNKASAEANSESFFSLNLLGVPVWAWIAGAAGVALLLTTSGPRMALSALTPRLPERATV